MAAELAFWLSGFGAGISVTAILIYFIDRKKR